MAEFSLIVAKAPLAEFMTCLTRRVDLWKVGDPARLAQLEFDTDDGEQYIAVGVYGGTTYVYDHYSAGIADAADLFSDMSAELQTTIAAGTVNPVLGIYTFLLARGGNLLRHYENRGGHYDAPYDVGVPLECERLAPLEDFHGDNIRRAFREVGFEVEPINFIDLTPYEIAESDLYTGPNAKAFEAFLRAHKR